ncbi:MAG: tyrosine-type recombinase/integrase [Elusimicrobia bacterium]|nr:tyrosine-type recombinase/integrase [Elusimicrobiota bacterium]
MERLPAVRSELAVSEQSYQAAIELFLLRCRSMNLSPHTITWYGAVLGGFAAFLDGLPERPLPRHTTAPQVRAYLEHLNCTATKTGRRVAPGSVRRFFVTLKTFFAFLERERVVLNNPMLTLEKPKAPKVVIRPLSPEQVQALLAQPKTRTFTGLRNWTMILLALDTGLRLSELLSIRTGDIDWAGSGITVLGKGAKERTVYFGAMAKKALWDYRQRRGDIPGVDAFFTDQFGRPVKPRWFQQVLARYGRSAGVEGVRVSPHTMRHTFAVSYILNGGDAFSLQRLLGHSTMETVKLCVGLANRDVALQHRKFSPMDRLGMVPGERRQVRLK